MDTPREAYDPETATVAETLCPECIDATLAHEPGTDYFDANGDEVDWFTPTEELEQYNE
jgi:hypothetical protein